MAELASTTKAPLAPSIFVGNRSLIKDIHAADAGLSQSMDKIGCAFYHHEKSLVYSASIPRPNIIVADRQVLCAMPQGAKKMQIGTKSRFDDPTCPSGGGGGSDSVSSGPSGMKQIADVQATYSNGGGYYTIKGDLTGSYYSMHAASGPVMGGSVTRPAGECVPGGNPIQDINELRQYILDNASRYSAAVVATAQAAIRSWQGTSMVIAAAVEFLFALLGFLGPAEIIALCVGAGIALWLIYEIADCFQSAE